MALTFRDGAIEGVVWYSLMRHEDMRGWLCELFRHDEIPPVCYPQMAYVSMTRPGVIRGPHEHRFQYDLFCFVGPSDFRVYLWDNRPSSPTYGVRQIVEAGESQPRAVIVPPGVVHAYRNIGSVPGWVFNAPNQLYAGWKRSRAVDEIRYENDPQSPFRIED
ncbi:MAG: dTDP-4-dehydrorhamnose 3,5-epimerase family protein [Gemmatales bacterium]|nr:dTDP-4-dehydrorhamnose 3,5-epimerase family protein [Gemmatales bacterium]